ncbi:MAG: DUF2325 domain-containing protein [Betaproteobacteria bacterium]
MNIALTNTTHYHLYTIPADFAFEFSILARRAAEPKMNAMLVGADRLGNIPDRLADLGITIIHHVSGRCANHQKRLPVLPRNLDVLILFTDFIGHNVMKSFRRQAQVDGVRVVACRRSASCLAEHLVRSLVPINHCKACPRRSEDEKPKPGKT